MKPLGSATSAPVCAGVSSFSAGHLAALRRRGWPIECCLLILAATIFAAILRVPRLEQRPMHGDEAVHAMKFRDLLEKGLYIYDPNEYHGPTLNYLTLIPAWLSSAKKLTEVNEFTLRIVPVFFGVLLILLLLLVTDGLGPGATVCAAVLTAISPAMVFYSRYYIHEMLLVCFTFGAIACGYRYTQNRNAAWAVLTGTFGGLMHATKETCIIAFGSMLLALWLMLLIRQRKGGSTLIETIRAIKPSHLIAAVVVGAIVSTLFYSSFLSNPHGVLDSFRTYATYFDRAGANQLHEHPWYYYLKMLIYFRFADGPIWSEALIVLLSVVGLVAILTKKGLPAVNIHLLRFTAFYTLSMTLLYSIIRYKTPWCMLGFLHGMILLAGVGAVALVKLAPNVLPRLIVLCLLLEGSIHLGWQAYLCNYKYYADCRNPYVYAHPTTDVFTIEKQLTQYARVHGAGYDMPIQVICPGDDYWPLPWYLRRFTNVGWLSKVPDDIAPLIIASPAVEADLTDKLYAQTRPEKRQLYMYLFDEPYYIWLRPKVKLKGFVRKDLWERLHAGPEPNELINKAEEK
jgi:uncharacterized protein (TIGR03663 family)